MRRKLPFIAVAALLGFFHAPLWAGDEPLAIRAGKVITMDPNERVLNNAIILVSGGKIEALGSQKEISIPAGYRVIDAEKRWVVPGLVDAHSHCAGALGDLNDAVYLTNPGMACSSGIMPGNENLKDGVSGGVTSAIVIPGSATNMEGFGYVVNYAGEKVEEMMLKDPGCIKIAQAGNPERYWYRVGRSYMNWNLRQTLQKAREYEKAWDAYEAGESEKPPGFDPCFHKFLGLFKRRFIALMHTQAYQVMMATYAMMVDEFNLVAVPSHCTFDGYKTAPLAKERNLFIINGPRQIYFDTTERRINGHAAKWWEGGIRRLSVNTDAPVIPQEELTLQAALACRFGWLPYEALRGITLVAAQSLMVDDRVGSIEAGKAADLGIWTGDPIDPRSSCELTLIRGKIVYNASKRRRF